MATAPSPRHNPEATPLLIAASLCALAFGIKLAAYYLSPYAAIFADAAASMAIFIVLVFSYISCRQQAQLGGYGPGASRPHSTIAGLQAGMIILAAGMTLVLAIAQWLGDIRPQQIELGSALLFAAGLVNMLLGVYLYQQGHRLRADNLQTYGHQIMAATSTSIAAVLGLMLYAVVSAHWVGPVVAMGIGLYIMIAGVRMLRRALTNQSGQIDPAVTQQLTEILSGRCAQYGIDFGTLRAYSTDGRHTVELSLLFPPQTEVAQAHRIASEIEVTLIGTLSNRAHIITRLQSAHIATEARL